MLLEAAANLADAVAATLGVDCEVAVHDLRRPRESLVHLANGHVTGRRLGAPIRDLLFRVLPRLGEGEQALLNYLTVLPDGRRLKSTTALLCGPDGHPTVAFCINLDITSLETGITGLSRLTSTTEETLEDALVSVDEPPALTNGARAGVTAVLEILVANVVSEYGRPPKSMTKSERLQVVAFLEEKGAFLVRGAVALIASRLAVSEPTIYRYLDEIRARRNESALR